MKLPASAVAGFVVCTLLAGSGYGLYRSGLVAGKEAEKSAWLLKWSQRDDADKAAHIASEKSQRDEEQRRKIKVEEIINEAEKEKQKALDDAASAGDVADQLRGALADTRRKLATSETGRISADAASRQTAASAGILLAELYEQSDRRAAALAEYADAAARAGRVCERTYSTVTRSVE